MPSRPHTLKVGKLAWCLTEFFKRNPDESLYMKDICLKWHYTNKEAWNQLRYHQKNFRVDHVDGRTVDGRRWKLSLWSKR